MFISHGKHYLHFTNYLTTFTLVYLHKNRIKIVMLVIFTTTPKYTNQPVALVQCCKTHVLFNPAQVQSLFSLQLNLNVIQFFIN